MNIVKSIFKGHQPAITYWNLLLLSCFLLQCSSGDSAQEEIRPDTYLTVDSTFIGISTIATDLDYPWEISWGPDDWIWMTEHGGVVSKINPENGKKTVLLKIDDVFQGTTPGLLGMAVYPDQEKFPYAFLLYTSKKNNEDVILNLVRYTVKEDTLVKPENLFEIPAAEGHTGSRIKISGDDKLIIANGDAQREMSEDNAQNPHSLVGKILRLNLDGSIPGDNPLPDSPVWSWGHRNQQGLTFGANNILYTSEHGPATDDEVNIIKKGHNYGWPQVEGFCDKSKEKLFCADSTISEPIKAWTPTIAPAGIAYYDSPEISPWQNSLILSTLKDASLHVLRLDTSGTSIADEHVYLQGKYGRLRDVTVSPQGDIYLSTSNTDWNPRKGFPKIDDDRILKLALIKNKNMLRGIPAIHEMQTDSSTYEQTMSQGGLLYEQHCQSCHKADGKGIDGSFPSLSESSFASGNRKNLISFMLNGPSGIKEVDAKEFETKMPEFNFLSDEEVAQVLTYIRSNFGNEAPKVSNILVKQMRKKSSKKE